MWTAVREHVVPEVKNCENFEARATEYEPLSIHNLLVSPKEFILHLVKSQFYFIYLSLKIGLLTPAALNNPLSKLT